MIKWQVDEMTSWWNEKVDDMTSWWNDKLMKWHFDKMTNWSNNKLTKWHANDMTDKLTSQKAFCWNCQVTRWLNGVTPETL